MSIECGYCERDMRAGCSPGCQRFVRNKRNTSKFDVYVGRPSIWGNPFSIGKDGNRDEVIQKYKKYLLGNEDLMKLLPTLKRKILGCWCAPLPCHADIISELANAHSEEEED